MNVDKLLAKAGTAISSAKVLLDVGDPDGACNRAYYAMFDAARAALGVVAATVPAESIRTHSGLIAAFGLHVVKPGYLSADMGRAFNRTFRVRQIADYNGETVSMQLAKETVATAEAFVTAVDGLRARPAPVPRHEPGPTM